MRKMADVITRTHANPNSPPTKHLTMKPAHQDQCKRQQTTTPCSVLFRGKPKQPESRRKRRKTKVPPIYTLSSS